MSNLCHLDKVFLLDCGNFLKSFDNFLMASSPTFQSKGDNCGRLSCQAPGWLSDIVNSLRLLQQLVIWTANWKERHQKVVKKIPKSCHKLKKTRQFGKPRRFIHRTHDRPPQNFFYVKSSGLEIQKLSFSRLGAKLWNAILRHIKENI